jgi:hypothetical protein
MLFSIGATEDAASGRAARPDGTAFFAKPSLRGVGDGERSDHGSAGGA